MVFQRVQPFGFRGNASPPVFDPATLPLDFYQKPDYPGSTILWPGTASAGASGSHSCPGASSHAAQGSPVNGHIPASFGSAACLGDAALDQYITGATFSGGVMFNAAAAAADAGSGSPYLNRQIVADGVNALFGVEYSVNGVSVWAYDGAWHRVQFTCGVGDWHALFFYRDGTDLWARLDDGVGPNAWSSVAVTPGFAGFALSTQNLALGTAPYSAGPFSGDEMELFLSKTQLPLSDFDDFYGYLKATYPAAGFP